MKKIIGIFILFLWLFPIVIFATQKLDKNLKRVKRFEENSVVDSSVSYCRNLNRVSVKRPFLRANNLYKAIPTILASISVSWMLQSMGVLAENSSSTIQSSREFARIFALCVFGVIVVVAVICYYCKCEDRVNKGISKCLGVDIDNVVGR